MIVLSVYRKVSTQHSDDVSITFFRNVFDRIMYPLRINYRIKIFYTEYYDILYFDVRITSILPYVFSYNVPTSYKLLIFSI